MATTATGAGQTMTSAAIRRLRELGRVGGSPWTPVVVCAGYGLLALLANWPAWPGDPSRTRAVTSFGVIGSTDIDAGTWFLAWTPYALGHHLSPFATTVLNYPRGVNIAQNTAMPLLALLVSPVTRLAGPIASMNVLLWLALALSATSMYLVLRRFVRRELAAVAGGLLYGFSPWIVVQDLYHLNLCFVPLPPVILLCVYELFRPGQTRPLRWGCALGVSTVAQFFVSPEVCATTVLLAAIATVVVAARAPRHVWPAILRAKAGVGATVVIVGVCLAYPVDAMFHGPYHFVGSPNPGGEGADLLSPVLPGPLLRVTLGHLGTLGSNLVFGNTSENGGYLGIPLVVLLVVVAVRYRRRRLVKLAAVMVGVSFVLSLGNHLVVDAHRTSFPLPFNWAQGYPVFDAMLQVRFGLYVVLFSAVLVAVGLDSVAAPGRAARSAWAGYGLGALSLVALVPRFPLPTSPADVPSYFSSHAIDAVRPGSVALVSPYPSVFDPVGQVWQAVAKDRFKMIGGYALFSSGGPATGGVPAPYPPPMQPLDVQMFLTGEADGTPFLSGPVPPLDLALECDTRAFLLTNKVETVISGPIPHVVHGDRSAIDLLFTFALGPPTAVRGGVKAWYHVGEDIRRDTAALLCPSG